MSEKEYYLEFFQLGNQVKVTAIDPDTGVEVSIIAPKTASKTEMTNVAVAKLKHILTKSTSHFKENEKPAKPKDKRGGILV